jgi:hypothetical protein
VLTDNVAGSPQSVPLSGTATGDFCFGPATAVTVTAGQTAVYSLAVNTPTAYKGTVSLACAGSPAAATCTAPVSVGVPSQFTVSVATAANSTPPPFGRRLRNIPTLTNAMIAALVGFLASFFAYAPVIAERRRSTRFGKLVLVAAALLAFGIWLDGCGGGAAGGDPSAPGTPAGTYSLTLSGTSANTTAQLTLTLTVQ